MDKTKKKQFNEEQQKQVLADIQFLQISPINSLWKECENVLKFSHLREINMKTEVKQTL